ncbi:helix-turn-helix domain-containing protein [Serratia nevei]|uniref:helix-turn-helix domain-containing protein n=1 Tax=Serratia marcescens TaxID=615 RepID=UPI00157C24C4|nr:helix-turn-helix domain-containing protein [Serratia marcescens]MDF8320738.1 helix-turn-helix domain-containing protein [Serratia nevei]MDF8326252.1 helix-turn-helix domain-containing protein [Serratia nevei]MDF8336294.1 helix-turn-helix domain-containing protein [Serratia nevei]MDF8346105.1 helix-turn-helix domain-containing protein [Serratia nevei]MDF8347326.1 helix-turn-helix domain-containing protein [Serratia nevei]
MKISIGTRLREERERLGFTQVAMGDLGGVRKQTQLKYEKGDNSPDAEYLFALSKFGLDVLYVVTGVRSAEALTNDEQELLGHFRSAPLAVKAAALAALTAGSSASNTVSVTGQGNRVAGRDYNENKK